MKNTSPLINAYELIFQQLQRMQQLAVAGDWAELIQEASGYVLNIEVLQRNEINVTESEAEKQRRRDLLALIIKLDKEIRDVLIARRDELGRLLEQEKHQTPGNKNNMATKRNADVAAIYQASERLGKSVS